MAKVQSKAPQQIDTYINKLPAWSKKICKKLQEIIYTAEPDIKQVVKWGGPAFEHDGLVCWFWAFKGHVSFAFFQGALIKDPKKLFDYARANLRNRTIKFTNISQVKRHEKTLIDYVRQAVKINQAGKKVKIPVSKDKTVVIPDYIKKILKDQQLLEKYNNQIYTYRKGYVRWIDNAKREETKKRRINTMLKELRGGKEYMGMSITTRNSNK